MTNVDNRVDVLVRPERALNVIESQAGYRTDYECFVDMTWSSLSGS